MRFPEVLLPLAELVHSITTTIHQASYTVSLFKFVIIVIFIHFILCVSCMNSSPVRLILLSIAILIILSNGIFGSWNWYTSAYTAYESFC